MSVGEIIGTKFEILTLLLLTIYGYNGWPKSCPIWIVLKAPPPIMTCWMSMGCVRLLGWG